MSAPVRLQRFLSQAGVAARRKAEEMIVAGRVKVNGQIVKELGTKVDPENDRVNVDGDDIYAQEHFYILFNKPKGCITAVSDDRGRLTVMDYLPNLPVAVAPVGRLDYYSEGVILLTNDGELAAKLLAPRSHVSKTYHVKVQGRPTANQLEALKNGVRLDDGTVTLPAEIETLPGDSKHAWLGITLHEGKQRQIHRMMEALGMSVTKLQRVAFANLTFHGLRVGDARELQQAELNTLRELVGLDHSAAARGRWTATREDTDQSRKQRLAALAESGASAPPPGAPDDDDGDDTFVPPKAQPLKRGLAATRGLVERGRTPLPTAARRDDAPRGRGLGVRGNDAAGRSRGPAAGADRPARSFDRGPSAGADRGPRRGPAAGADRPARSFDRGPSAGADRPARSFDRGPSAGADRGPRRGPAAGADRPARSFDRGPSAGADRGPRRGPAAGADRPARSFDRGPSAGADRGPRRGPAAGADRPARSFDRGPSAGADRGPRRGPAAGADRPARSFDRGPSAGADRGPRRGPAAGADRPARSFDRGPGAGAERPPRRGPPGADRAPTWGEDRPPRGRGPSAGADRPARGPSRGPGADRPARGPIVDNNRPARNFDRGAPSRPSGGADRAPARSGPGRPAGGKRPPPRRR